VELDPAGPDADLLELENIVEESLEGVVRISRIVNDMLRFSRVPEEAAEPVDHIHQKRAASPQAGRRADRNASGTRGFACPKRGSSGFR
jgi:hypothetical protein